jgi:hypothetical protein
LHRYLPQLTKWAIDQANKTEPIVKFLKERGLLSTEIKDDVDVVYIYALVEYGMSKQEKVAVAILDILRHNEVKNVFWTAYTNNDPFGFLRKTEEFLKGKIELRNAIKSSDAKLEVELEDFGEIFISIANRTGTNKFQPYPVWNLDPFEKKFKAIIQQKTDLFSGRKFVFDKFRNFLSNNNNGYFIIIGDPGMGKSTIASKYVLAHKCPCYFNSFLDIDNSPAKFLENIRKQLVRRYSLKNADQDDLSTLLQRVSENLLEGQKLIIVVDALDELDQKEGGNLLGLPEYLPNKVYFLITRRPCNESTKRLNIAFPYEEFDLRDKDKKDLSKNADGATSTLESRQGKLYSSSSSNVILQSMAANLH